MVKALASPVRGAGARFTGGGRGRESGSPSSGELNEGPLGWLVTSDAPLLKVRRRNFTRPSFGLVFLSTFSVLELFSPIFTVEKGDANISTGKLVIMVPAGIRVTIRWITKHFISPIV